MSFLRAWYSGTPKDTPIQRRPLSLHERYTQVGVNTRQAHTISFLYQYPSLSLPSVELLHKRVDKVQAQVHHLWSEVVDGETPRPFLQLRPDGPWPASKIVRENTYPLAEGAVAGNEEASVAMEADLLAQEIARMKDRVADGGPAWQVTRYHPEVTSATSPSYIAISAYHNMVDGTGALRLCLAVLSDYTPPPSPGLAARMEDVVPVAPSLLFLAKEVFHDLLVPALPSFLRSALTPAPCWPGTNVRGNPTAFPEAQVSTHLPATWIPALKRAGQANGVSTLHPIIETALVMALHETMDCPQGHIEVGTPINERDPSDPAHPHVGSIFVSVLDKAYSHTILPPKRAFADGKDTEAPALWDLARGTATHHASPEARKHSRHGVGIMGYIPDPKSFSSPHSENPDRRTQTAWEDFFWSAIERPAPFRISVGMSNLGRTDLPPGCSGMRWTQSAYPFLVAVQVSVIGHEQGLEVTSAFRDGCAITKDEVHKVLAKFMEILGGLI